MGEGIRFQLDKICLAEEKDRVFLCDKRLWKAVKEAWVGVQADHALLKRLAQSVPKRLGLVQKAQGGLVMY